MTRLYQESSFDSLQITGDFVVVNINESSILSNYSSFNIYDIINASIDLININGLQTLFGNNSFEDYFYSSARDSTLSFVIFMVRNITDQYGGLDQGQGNSGFNYNDLKRIKIENAYYKIGHYTKQCVATSNIALSVKSITTHEIAHQILGTNAAHSSGGNHYGSKVPMPFFTIQGGYGLEWKSKVNYYWNEQGHMDFLFGKNLEKKIKSSQAGLPFFFVQPQVWPARKQYHCQHRQL
jgi:hypothetical protein